MRRVGEREDGSVHAEDMTDDEKAAEKALNQQLLVAKGVLFAAVIGYFAFTSL